MKKVTRPELNSTSFVTATDVRNRKIVRTVSVNGFQVGMNDSEYKPGLRVWGGVDLPVDVPPEDKDNKLYTQRGATGHGVITYDDIPIGGVSSDFLRKQFTDQLETNECRGDIVRYIVGSDEKLKKAFAHHYAPDGRWKVSRANHLASSPRAGSNRRALVQGEEDYEEGQGVLCLSFGESAHKHGMLLRGFARMSPTLIHNIPSNVKARAVYLSADEPGHLDFEPTTVRVGVAIDRADNNKGDVLIYFDHVGAGVQGDKGEKGDKGDKGDPIIFDLSANRNFFEMKNGSYTNLGNIKLKVRRKSIVGTDGDVVKWHVKKATGSFQLVTNDDFIAVDTTDLGRNKSTMSSSQFDLLRDGDTFVTVKAEITDSVDGQVYEDEEDIHLMVVNDGKDGKDGKDAKKFDLKLSRNSFYMDPNGMVNDAWPANTPIELKVDIDNIIPNPEIQWEVKKQGGTYQIVSPIDVILNFVSPLPYLVTLVDVNQFNAIRDNTEVITVRASTVDQDGVTHSEEREINLVVNGKNNKDFDLNADGEIFVMDSDGNINSANPSNSIITFRVDRTNVVGSPDIIRWYVAENGGTPQEVTNTDRLTIDSVDSNIATMTAEQFDFARDGQASVIVTAEIIDTLVSPNVLYSDSKRVRFISEKKGKDAKTVLLQANPKRFYRNSDGIIDSSDPLNVDTLFKHSLTNLNYADIQQVKWQYRLSNETIWSDVVDNSFITINNFVEPGNLTKALEASMSANQFASLVGNNRLSVIIQTIVVDNDAVIYINEVTIDLITEKGGKDGKDGKDVKKFDLTLSRNSFYMDPNGGINSAWPANTPIQLDVEVQNITPTPEIQWEVKKQGGTYQIVDPIDTLLNFVSPTPYLQTQMDVDQFNIIRDNMEVIVVKASTVDQDGIVHYKEREINLVVNGKNNKDFDLDADGEVFVMDSDGDVSSSNPSNSTITFKVTRNNIVGVPDNVTWFVAKNGASPSPVVSVDKLTVNPADSNIATMTAEQFDLAREDQSTVVVTASILDTLTAPSTLYSDNKRVRLIRETKAKANRNATLHANPMRFIRGSDGNISSSDPRNIEINFHHNINGFDYGNVASITWSYRLSSSSSTSWITVTNNNVLTRINSSVPLDLNKALQATMTAAQFVNAVGANYDAVIIRTQITDDEGQTYTNTITIDQTIETKGGDAVNPRLVDLRANPLRFIRNSSGIIDSSDSRNINVEFKHSLTNLTYINVQTVKWQYRLSNNLTWIDVTNNDVVTRINSVESSNLNKALEASMNAAQFATLVGSNVLSVIVRTIVTDENSVNYINEVTIDLSVETKGTDGNNPRTADLDANPSRFFRGSDGNISPTDPRNQTIYFEHTLRNFDYSKVQSVQWSFRRIDSATWFSIINNDYITRINPVDSSLLNKALTASMSTAQFNNFIGTSLISIVVRAIITDDSGTTYTNQVTIDQTVETKGNPSKTATLVANPLTFNRNSEGNITSTDSRNISVLFKHNLTNFVYSDVASVRWRYRRSDSNSFTTVANNSVITRINSIDNVINKALEASMTAEQFASVVGSGNYSVIVETLITENSGATYLNEITINLNNDGKDGDDSSTVIKNLELKSDSNVFKKLEDGSFTPTIINLELQRTNLTGNASWFLNGVAANSSTLTLASDFNSATMTPAQFQAAGGDLENAVKVSALLDGLDDSETIFMIEDGKTVIEEPKDLRLTQSHLFFRTNSNDVTSPNHIEFNATKISITSTLVWKVNDVAVTSSTLTLQNETNARMNFAQFLASGGSVDASVKVSVEADGIVRFVNIGLIVDVKPPEVTKTFMLTVKPENFHAKYDGTVEVTDSRNLRDRKLQIRQTGLNLTSVQWLVKKGSSTSYQSAGSNITTVTNSLLAGLNAAQFNTIRAGEEFINVKAIGYEGASPFEDEVTVSLIKDGPPKLLKLNVDTPFITYKNNGTYEPNGFNFNVQLQVVEAANLIWYVNGNPYNPTNDKKLNILAGNINATMSPIQFEDQNSARASINLKVRSDIDDLEDSVTVTMLVERPIIRSFDLTVSRITFTADSNDFVDPLIPSNSVINFQVVRDGFESTTPVVWQLEVGGVFVDITTQYTYPLSSPFLSANMSAEQFNAIRGGDEVVRIKAVSVEGGTTYERTAEISLIKMPSKEVEREYGDISLIASRYAFHKGLRNYDPSSAIQFEVRRGEGVNPFPFVQWKVKKATASSYSDVSVSDATNLTVPNDLATNPGYNLSSMSTTQFDALRSNESSVFVRADLVVPNTNTYDPNVNFYSSNSAEIYRGSGNLAAWLRPRSGNKPLNSVMPSNSVYVNQLYYAKPQTRSQNLTVNSYDYPALAMENGNAIVAHSDIFNFTDAVADKPFSISFLLKTPASNTNFGNSVIIVKNKENSSLYDSSNNYQYAIYTQNASSNRFSFVFKFIGQNATDSLTFTSSALSPFNINGVYYITFSFSPSENNANKLKIYYNGNSISTSFASSGTWSKMYYNASSPSFINIGSNGDAYVQAMVGGLISEILIHNRNLSFFEHKALYNAVLTNSCNEYYTRNVEITRTVDRKLEMDPMRDAFVKNQFDEYHPELQFKSFTLFKNNIEEPIVWTVNGSSTDVSSKITITPSTTAELVEVNQSQFENNKDSSDRMVIKAVAHGLNASATIELLKQNFKIIPEKIAEVVAGFDHAMVLTTSGKVYAWGSNQYGQLGISEGAGITNPIVTPKLITFDDNPIIVQISAGQYYSAALDAEGFIWTWGSNSSFRTGQNKELNYDWKPNKLTNTLDYNGNLSSTNKFKKISCGPDFGVAIGRNNNKIYCWGNNEFGKCGVTAYTSLNVQTNPTISRPRCIQSDNDSRNFVDVSAGSYHCLALSSGKIYAWGRNLDARTGLIVDDAKGPISISGIPQSVGTIITSSGYRSNVNYANHIIKEVMEYNGNGKPPSEITGFKKISAGYKHNLALRQKPDTFEPQLWGFGDCNDAAMGSIYSYPYSISSPTVKDYVALIRIDEVTLNYKNTNNNELDEIAIFVPILGVSVLQGQLGVYSNNITDNNFQQQNYVISLDHDLAAGHGTSCLDSKYQTKYFLNVGRYHSYYQVDSAGAETRALPFWFFASNSDDYFKNLDSGYFAFLAVNGNSVSTSKGLDDNYRPFTLVSRNGNFLWSFGYNRNGAAGHSDSVNNYIVGTKRVTILDRLLGIESETDAYLKLQDLL